MKRRKDAGFSLAALIFFATAVSIVLSAAYPAYQMQAKRQREEELIFRGEEYARAIQKFQRKFGVYPPSVDALLQTNGIRFLRRAYKDPITGQDFRLIHINPDGTLTGSTLASQRINNTPLFGAPLQTFGGQTSAPSQPSAQPRQPGAAQPPAGSVPQTGPVPQTSSAAGQPGAGTSPPAFSLGPRPQAAQPAIPQPGPSSPPAFQQPSGGTVGSAGVVGVASDSTEASVKVYNTRQKYNEWEFIAIMTPNAPQPPGTGGQPGGTPPLGAPQPPGVSAPPGGASTNPFQTPSQPFKRP